MKALLFTDLIVYGVLLVASYFLVFRRKPAPLDPAPMVEQACQSPDPSSAESSP